ncbi:MAG: hypothetical protein MHM6MM_002698 [Cercozoa sp. M6MM]
MATTSPTSADLICGVDNVPEFASCTDMSAQGLCLQQRLCFSRPRDTLVRVLLRLSNAQVNDLLGSLVSGRLVNTPSGLKDSVDENDVCINAAIDSVVALF